MTSPKNNTNLTCKNCGTSVSLLAEYDSEYGEFEVKVVSFSDGIGALLKHHCDLATPIHDKFIGERTFAIAEEQVDKKVLENVKAAAEEASRSE